jgi:hypothetical protein
MSIAFASPSMRAAGSDLTVAISPLGLVELADEEFEVHGPRLNRYAQAWAFYLGHHWGYRREMGEPQVTFNYVKAFADYINNFSFGRGVHFGSAREYQHIIPALLKQVWEVDNDKPNVLWEMGNQGGVSGDCFVKVAWDPAYEDAVGGIHPGRVRILPLNASYCFPEWHPHDRDRLLRFKLKYRFWGTSTEGTRQVYTYTEILTDDVIEEYVNDELIDSRENPLGRIPVVHIPNVPVSGSPWGLSDVESILMLNRQYNEVSTDIADIINYHAAPVTIITGAKASNLEKGPKKVWGGLPKDANVFNLEGGTAALPQALEYLETLKRSMHELTGVPETALGQMQPISNTSGVALSIQFQPLMQRDVMKKLQYTKGLKQINSLALQTLFTFNPETLKYNPNTQGIIEPGDTQPLVLDPYDPLVYETEVEWPQPLPVDKLIKLNEIQAMMAIGLESKRGALKALGEEFPDEKAEEIFKEQVEDAKEAGALALINAHVNAAIVQLTGMVPPDGSEPAQQDSEGSDSPGAGSAPALQAGPNPYGPLAAEEIQQMITEIVTQAYGTKLPQRSAPDSE